MGSCHSKLGFVAFKFITVLIIVSLQLNKPHNNGVLTSYIKGAPERVLAKCSTYIKGGVPTPIDDDFRAGYDDAYNVCRFPILHTRY